MRSRRTKPQADTQPVDRRPADLDVSRPEAKPKEMTRGEFYEGLRKIKKQPAGTERS